MLILIFLWAVSLGCFIAKTMPDWFIDSKGLSMAAFVLLSVLLVILLISNNMMVLL